MNPLLLISGMYQASWCWRPVRDRLEAAGLEVVAPDLAGLGADGAGSAIDLETHVAQVAEIAEKTARPFVACAHSYGGTVLIGAADRAPSGFAALVLLDANFPQDGCSVLDRYSPELRSGILKRTNATPQGAVVPPPPAAALGLPLEPDRQWFDRCMKPQPLATLLQPLRLTGAWRKVPRKCAVTALQGPRGGDLDAVREAASLLGFEWTAMQGGHQLMIEQPEAVAALLAAAVRHEELHAESHTLFHRSERSQRRF